MSNSLFDPKQYKHIKSDKHSTTIQHKKGHTLTIAHNVISPKMRQALEALGSISGNQTEPQQQEEQDKSQYGKVIMKADGGKVDPKFAAITEKQKVMAKKQHPEPSPEEKKALSDKHKSQDQFMKNTTGKPMKVEMDAQGGNAGEQRKKIFGKTSAPTKGSDMQSKHIEHIRDFAKKLLATEVVPSGGKINEKTGERRDESPEAGVDKPDWRSGQLESQWNPDAIVHELAHLILMPKGIGLEHAQRLMDKKYSDVQKQYGYMKQKRSHGEIQPMAVENLLRRHLGLPPAKQSVPVKPGEGPRLAVEDQAPAGVRIQQGDKTIDLIRQSRLLSPENRQRVEHVMSGRLKFHPKLGWQENPEHMGAKVRLHKEEKGEIPTEGYDEGGKVAIPDSARDPGTSDRQRNLRDASTVEKQPTDNSQAATASNPSQIWSNIKNGWAEGGAVSEPSEAELGGLPSWFHTAGEQSHPTHHADVGHGGADHYAYDAGLPCLNPHCKSHGQPHPNCKCYTGGEGYAEGGEVSKLRYCAHGKPHESSCAYATGGNVEYNHESNDHLQSSNRNHPGMSEQGRYVRGMDSGYENRPETRMRHAKIEAKSRIQEGRHVKPKLQGLAEGGQPIIPYGMNQTDYDNGQKMVQEQNAKQQPPQDESQMENNLSQYEAQGQPQQVTGMPMNPDTAPAQEMSPVLQPGMPGYDEPHAPINDTEQPPTQERAPAQAPKAIPADDHYGDPAVDQAANQGGNQAPMPAAAPAPPPPTPEQHLTAQHVDENKKFQQDLLNGHITPKTYNDLMYHNKDGTEKSTLGKINSIFGLVLSGFGAGLAHQPVMAMQMMDNAIKNDLDAQMKSKDNAQNFIKLNQQRLLNDANVKQILASADLTDAQKQGVIQANKMKAYTQSFMDARSTAMFDILRKIKTMPEGTEKQRMVQLAMVMGSQVEEANMNTAVMGAAGVNALSMYGVDPNNQAANDPEAKFQNDMRMREMSGDPKQIADVQNLKERHIPGIPGFATAAIPGETRNKIMAMNTLDNKVKDVLSYAKQHRGSVDPRVLAVARQKAEELTSFYNNSVDNLGMTSGRLGWLEEQIKKNPTSLIQQLLGNNARLGEIQNSNSTRRDNILYGPGGLGFQKPRSAGGQGQPQYKTDAQGVKWMRGPNGEAIKVN